MIIAAMPGWRKTIAVLAAALLGASSTGCVRLGFDHRQTGDAAGRDGAVDRLQPDAPADLAPDGPVPDHILPDTAADPLAPFGAPQPVTELNTNVGEDDPTLTTDMLEILFDRDGDIFRAVRDSVSDAWGTPQPVTELNTASQETSPELSEDGLTLYLSSDRPSGPGLADIYLATRADRSAAWSAPTLVAWLSSSTDDSPGWTSSDDLKTMISVRTSDGDIDIFLSVRDAVTSHWGALQPVDELNSATDHDGSPWLTQDLLVIYFNRVATGPVTNPGNILISTRDGIDTPFSAPVPVPGINTSYRASDPWLSPDMRTMYFASTRAGGAQQDIYVAGR